MSMLTISDSVEITATPGEVWSWLCELLAHYTEWHPDHRECHVVRGPLWTFAWLFRHRLSALRRHQSEEGANLKRILEREAGTG
jgi:hypothetical protein